MTHTRMTVRLLIVATAAFTAALVLATLTKPTPPTCGTEDEVLVRVEGDAFDFAAGDHACVHIDHLEVP